MVTAYLLMTSAYDRNDLVTTQEKLEWVTPQISLMGSQMTEGKDYAFTERPEGFFYGLPAIGPS